MASETQQTPFIKQLAANDRPTREKALSSLQNYLSSGRTFSNIELLKIWKGLFFCVFHTDRPLPQQRLSNSLAALLLTLPTSLFLPFLHAFWSTLIPYWASIQGLRLDKYLYLIRQYISHSFIYLANHEWERGLVEGYVQLLEQLPLSPSDGKVPDGIRYHVCDVWVDGLVEVEGWEGVEIMRPIERLGREGRTRVVKERAKGVLGDERLEDGLSEASGSESGEGDFEGFDE